MTVENIALGDPPFSSQDFRAVLGVFPTGVAVITAHGSDGAALGATVNSFSSVSMDPPLILFSMAKSAKAYAEWERVKKFVVNILAEDQHVISTQFARALSNKWDGVNVARAGAVEAPALADAMAHLECETYEIYEGGDHAIILGRVLALRAENSNPRKPLVFFKGKYDRLAGTA
jgi:flavin reductase (DIM6/NTAB) family NADH-FMN oxidoreductase RutF